MLTDIFPGAVDEGEEAVELAGKPGERDGWCCNLLGPVERTFDRLQLAEEQDQGNSEINIVRKEPDRVLISNQPSWTRGRVANS